MNIGAEGGDTRIGMEIPRCRPALAPTNVPEEEIRNTTDAYRGLYASVSCGKWSYEARPNLG
jgi:hypothetical protein